MENNRNLLETATGFCLAWFKQRNLSQVVEALSEDVSFMGAGEEETLQGLDEFRDYLKQDLLENQTPFELEFVSLQQNPVSCGTGIVMLEFNLKNSDCQWHIHGTFTLTRSEEGWKIRHLHFAVPVAQQATGEHYPLTLVKKHFAETRNELLSSSIAGGLMGGYLEDRFPFYCINDRMLAYLGYRTEEEFVRDVRGYIANCIHPDDWKDMSRSIFEQLEKKGEYTVEYRMRKRDGKYIYVHDVGKTVIAEDGRPAVLSVCADVSEQRFEKQQNENLIRAINGGTMICKVLNDRFLPVYLSSGIVNLTGYSQQELEKTISKGLGALIYPQDKEKVFSVLRRVIESKENLEETYRVRHKNGSYVWVTSIFHRIGDEDGAPLLHCIFTSLSKQFELQNDILNGSHTGIYVIDPNTYELFLANEAAFQIMERPICDYAGQKCYEVFVGTDSPCEHCILRVGSKEPKEMYIPRLEKTVTITAQKAHWMSKDVVIEYLHDITKQKKAQEELMLGEKRLSAAIHHAGVQFWEYDVQRGRAYISDFSQRSYQVPQVMDRYPDSFLELGLIHPEDQESYRALHQKLKDGAKDVMLEYRVRKPGEDYHWLFVHYTNNFDKDGRPVRAFATAEHIDRYKELEEQFTVAASLTGVHIWTLDIPNRTIYFSGQEAKGLGINQSLSCQSEEDLRETGLIHPDDIKTVWEQSEKIFQGTGIVSFQIRTKNGGEYRWNKVSYTVVKSKNGTPVKAIGSSIDIHEHVLLEQRFEQELEYSTSLQEPNLIGKAQCNITKGTVDLYLSGENTSVAVSGADYQESEERLLSVVVEPGKREQFQRLLDRKRILDAYAKGETYFSFEYQRKDSNGILFWANTLSRTYQNPATGDIMSFMYTYNIDDQKTAEAIVDRVVDTNFEYLTLFNIITGIVVKSIDKSGLTIKPEMGKPYETVAEAGLRQLLLPEELEEYLPQFKIKNIAEKLSQNGTYSISADIFDPKLKEIRHKLWVYNWFDQQHTTILCCRSDITEVYLQEQRQKEALSAALTAAKQANAAKTDFLSRMSHEIRTPMNAIIGMTAIAAKSIGNNDQVSDCISKIGISSRFLLSLINDILDMSRIESGKMLLKSEEIPFKEFVTGINIICHTQAAAKDVEYECIVDPVMDECYIGDAMKLQQVLVNILGNAIKFTSGGGKVTLSITQRKRTKNDAVLRFVINDTGIGMSEEFLPHLFEPFEQESNGITVGFGGTGLGLAISKNIVDLMDGKIQVRSIKGVGTEFTVDVKLGITEEEKLRHQKKQHNHNFSHLKTLVVDDDITVCESAVLTLKEIGITAEWVDSGRVAINRVQEMWQEHRYYDMILIDWKMPEMDGIETSRRIREIVGPDVTIIIMTAYDWGAIEQEAKAVGVNLLMSKPMFKSSLISVFSKALDQKEEEKQAENPVEEFNFTGRRLLLVEDQPINLEIAQMLLEDVGFQVETAENGLRAIEMFSKTEAGYYDAILMDIRMPIMDGLQASTNIRHLSNQDAKTIPIIAMTADAFDEDADKSKAAGMNFHLSKPIDPPRLYQTLYNFICQEDAEEEQYV